MLLALSSTLTAFAQHPNQVNVCGLIATDVVQISNQWAVASRRDVTCIKELLGALGDPIAPHLTATSPYSPAIQFDLPPDYHNPWHAASDLHRLASFVSADGRRVYDIYSHGQRKMDLLFGGLRQMKINATACVTPAAALHIVLDAVQDFTDGVPNNGWAFQRTIAHKLEHDGTVYAELKVSDYYIVHEWANAATGGSMRYVADASKVNSSTVYFNHVATSGALAALMFR